MDFYKNLINTMQNCQKLPLTLSTEDKSLQKIRTVPNIIKRKYIKKMDYSRTTIPTVYTEKGIKRKKQIFDPVRSELLMWENSPTFKPIVSHQVNINNMDFNENLLEKIKSNVLNYSPMWCPTSKNNYFNEQNMKIIETITVNSPIYEITNSIYNELIEPEFHEFLNQMNMPGCFNVENSDVETIIELSRFEYKVSNDKLKILSTEDPFNNVILKNSWNKYECLSCEKIYSSQSGLNWHLKKQHKRIPKISVNPVIVLTCPGCFRIFKTSSGYDRHIIDCKPDTIQFREE